jgi:hypothetical protein
VELFEDMEGAQLPPSTLETIHASKHEETRRHDPKIPTVTVYVSGFVYDTP